ncbi:MAG: hypothetical protein GXY74_02790 [Phycisphaerae bacterium]|nr:hypothetical protein [Phycisphaerae bacterium]
MTMHCVSFQRCVAVVTVVMATLVVVVSLGSAGGADDVASAAARERPSAEIVLLFTSDTGGALSGCGCAGGPAGGLTRLSAAVAAWRRGGRPSVLVHAGNLLARQNENDGSTDRDVLRAVRLFGFDAVNLGPYELRRPASRVAAWNSAGDLPAASADVRPARTGGTGSADEAALFWPAVVTVQRGGVRVAIVGLSGGRPPDGGGYTIGNMAEAARAAVARVRESAHLVVVLYGSDWHQASELAANVPGLDVIVCGGSGKLLLEPKRVERTLIVQAGPNGDRLGVLILRRADDGSLWAAEQRLLTLTDRVPDDPRITEIVFEREGASGSEGQMRGRQGKREGEHRTDSLLRASSSQCGACHEGQFKNWSESPHGRSLESLAALEPANREPCYFCHAADPADRLKGLIGELQPPQPTPVGCQDCHAVDISHGQRRKKPPAARPTKEVCLSCHTYVDSPGFDFAAYRRRIAHPSAMPAGTKGEATPPVTVPVGPGTRPSR